MRIAGSEGFTQICRSETLTTKSISIPDSYQSEGFTPVCRIAGSEGFTLNKGYKFLHPRNY